MLEKAHTELAEREAPLEERREKLFLFSDRKSLSGTEGGGKREKHTRRELKKKALLSWVSKWPGGSGRSISSMTVMVVMHSRQARQWWWW